MLESLVSYRSAEKRPWIVFFWALLISTVGVLFSIQLSYQIQMSGATINLAGIFSVVFTLLPSVYFLTLLIKKQELMDEKDIAKHYSKAFWHRHERDTLIFLFYFFGLTISYAVWGFILPADTFQIQMLKIHEIRGMAGSMFSGTAVAGTEVSKFLVVLMNNLQVMGFSFVFSLMFGAGAVFIIVWNASILGVYIGRLSESLLHIPGVSMSFLPHGIPEISAYLVAGIAGGLISASIIRGHKREIIFGILIDALKLMGVALLFVFLGAIIETTGFLYKAIALFAFYTIFIFMITNALSNKGDGEAPEPPKGKKK